MNLKNANNLAFIAVVPGILIGSILISMPIMLFTLGYGILIQLYIYTLYKKENRGKEFITRMWVPLSVAVACLLFFLAKEFI